MQTDTSIEPHDKNSINWPTLLFTGLIALVVSVIGGMTIYYLQLRGPKLIYSISSGLPFDGNDHTISTYQVTLMNDGNQSVDEVTGAIYLPNFGIDQKHIDADPSQSYTFTSSGDTIRFTIPSINPSEHVVIKFLATGVPGTRAEPKVSVRGHGITGVLKSNESPTEKENLFLPLIASSLLALTTSMLVLKRVMSRLQVRGHSDDQRRVFAYILRLNGFVREADILQATATETKYWSESDKLTRHAIDSGNADLVSRSIKVLTNLLAYAAVHPESKALIQLDLAKLHSVSGQEQQATHLVTVAKANGGNLVARRIELDPELKSRFTSSNTTSK